MLCTVSGMLRTDPGMYGGVSRMLRDALYRLGDAPHCPGMLHAVRAPPRGCSAPRRPGDASPVKSAYAAIGNGVGRLRRVRVRVGGARGRCGQPGSRTPPGAALIDTAAPPPPPPVNTAAPGLSMEDPAPRRPLATGRGGQIPLSQWAPAERGCWREWQGGTPRYPRYRPATRHAPLPRYPRYPPARRGTPRCPLVNRHTDTPIPPPRQPPDPGSTEPPVTPGSFRQASRYAGTSLCSQAPTHGCSSSCQ